MKIILAVLILLMPYMAEAVPAFYRYRDGKLEFAVGRHGNKLFWTTQQRDDYALEFQTATVISIPANNFYTAISTNLKPGQFQFDALTTKSGLFNKLLDLKSRKELAAELNDSALETHYKSLFDYLSRFYAGLE